MADATRDLKGVIFVVHTGTPQSLFATFRLPIPGFFGNLAAEISVRHTASPIDVFAKFELQLINDLFAELVVRHTGTAELFSKLIVSQDLDEDLGAEFVVRQIGTADLFTELTVRQPATEDLKGTFTVRYGKENLKTLSLINGFGNVVTEATARTLTNGYIFGTKFTMGPTLAIGSTVVFWYSPDSVINYARGAIYTVDGDRPGTLISETTLSSALSGEGWKELSFTDKPSLEAGVDYFILVWVNRSSEAEVRYGIPDATLRGYTRGMGGAPVGSFTDYDPMPGGAERSYLFSIYATYDLAISGTKDLYAKFEVAQGSEDLAAKFLLRQLTGDLKATFTLPETEELYAKFIVAQDNGDLFASFEAQVSLNLFAKFTVSQDFEANLFCYLELYRPYANLFAKTFIIGANTGELYSKFTVYNGGSEQLFAKALIAQPLTEDLGAEFIVRNSATYDLFAEFELQDVADLKATLYIPSYINRDAYYPIIDSEFVYWMNYNQVAGRGFIGFPEYEDDAVDYTVPPNSLKISADRVQKGYKEFTFGWLYEGVDLRYWTRPPCVDGKQFTSLVRENWNGFEEFTVDYTNIEKDNYLRRKYLTDYGAGGLSDITDNYGASDTLKIARYTGWMPGDLSYQIHKSNCVAIMKWDLDELSGIDLARFAWARIELYRYGKEGSIQGNALRTDRMPDCKDVDVRYAQNNVAKTNPYGGCRPTVLYTSTSDSNSEWRELEHGYNRLGDDNMSFQASLPPYIPGQYQYGNESLYNGPGGFGFTWDNGLWDMVDLSNTMLEWLNGTWKNHGMSVRMTSINQYQDYKQFDNAINYYSRQADSSVNDYKPKLRVKLYPENLKWTFSDLLDWDINTMDPYSGTAALRLYDWSKVNWQNIGSEHTTARPSMVLKDQDPKEGYIETAFRLNTEEIKKIQSDNVWGSVYTLEEGTPTANYLNVYFRYQDSDDHYRVEFNKKGTSCRIMREVSGAETALNTFSGNFKVAEWYKVRVTFALTEDGNLKICCYKFNDFNNYWQFLAGAVETGDPYWPDGGEVRFETLDCDLDETDVWEVQ